MHVIQYTLRLPSCFVIWQCRDCRLWLQAHSTQHSHSHASAKTCLRKDLLYNMSRIDLTWLVFVAPDETGHRPLDSIQLCLVLTPPPSSSCISILLSMHISYCVPTSKTFLTCRTCIYCHHHHYNATTPMLYCASVVVRYSFVFHITCLYSTKMILMTCLGPETFYRDSIIGSPNDYVSRNNHTAI